MIRSATPAELLGELNSVEAKVAPSILHYAGDPSLLGAFPRVAIVGSRNADGRDVAFAFELARSLVEAGAVVVSGLARGIDTAAHEGAMAGGGHTIAVIGTGLERFYPPENRRRQQLLMQKHLVVSQFAPSAPPLRKSFPMRNQTMALLSDATIIVTAGEKSGTRHQGWEAIKLGRELYFDANLLHAGVSWASKMLEYRATAYESMDDLLNLLADDLGVIGPEPRNEPVAVV